MTTFGDGICISIAMEGSMIATLGGDGMGDLGAGKGGNEVTAGGGGEADGSLAGEGGKDEVGATTVFTSGVEGTEAVVVRVGVPVGTVGSASTGCRGGVRGTEGGGGGGDDMGGGGGGRSS